MMRGGLSAFRARGKQLSATLEASVAQFSSPPGTSDAFTDGTKGQPAPGVPLVLAEPEPEGGINSDDEAGAELDAGDLVSPGPTAFGLRKVGNRSDPWCLSAISEESYGTVNASEHQESGEGVDDQVGGSGGGGGGGGGSKLGADISAGSDGSRSNAEVTPCPREGTVDERTWHSVIWADESKQNVARLASFDGRAALLRCLRNAATSQPETTPLAPEVWWRLGDLLAVGLSEAMESGEMELAVDLLVSRESH